MELLTVVVARDKGLRSGPGRRSGDRLLALSVLAVLISGCGVPLSRATSDLSYQSCRTTPEGFTACEGPGPLPPGSTPPPPPVPVVASADGFAGVPLGTPEDEAEARLVEVLGPPELDEEQPCLRADLEDTLAQPLRGRRLVWRYQELTVFLSPDASGALLLSGWQATIARITPSTYDVRLPYGVELGEPVEDALARLPEGREQDGRDDGLLLLTTPDEPGLVLSAFASEDDPLVREAAYDPEGCG